MKILYFTTLLALANAATLSSFKAPSFDITQETTFAKRDIISADFADPNLIYSIEVKVGSNKDPVRLQFDTGSFDAHVVDIDVLCNNQCQNLGTFDSNESTSLVRLNRNITSNYGLSSVGETVLAGELVKDDFTIGDITIKQFPFVDDNYINGRLSGMLGMGHSQPKERNPVWSAYEQGLIPKPAYSFYLGDHSFPGKVYFGGYDKAKLDGEFSWHSINNTNIQGHSDYMVVEGHNITINKNYTVDTGGDGAYMPEAIYNQLLTALPEESDYNKKYNYRNCSLYEGKTFEYSINGKLLTVPLKSFLFPDESGSTCFLGVSKGDYAQLGAMMFRYFHVAVDFEKELIGFGQLKNTTETNVVPF
ncbi:unnamed protein product [Candida verbasci]|uniref:Peptidase A1 domain-containing protein n=1 Tax=Candida verbasci TaxID=1227364 RepID=A0A9W4TWC9_9ASCO|nr:unnamed protein product [Candida verbasci]